MYADWWWFVHDHGVLLDDVAGEPAEQKLVAKPDTDRNPAMAEHFGIRGIPR